MKKIFFILLFFINNLFHTKAQDFGGGMLIGVSSSQVSGDNLGGFNKAGLLIGIFGNKLITPLLKFQMEMNFIMKGSNNNKINDFEHKDYLRQDISLSYLEIPLLLKYNQNKIIDFEAGLHFSYLINGFYNDINGKIESNVSPFIEYDLGMLIGLTYKYTEKINFNTRISNSIVPIGKEDYENNQAYNTSKKGKYNSVLSFAIHYNL